MAALCFQQAALGFLHSSRPSRSSLWAPMDAILPSSSRKLEFEEHKVAQATPAEPSKKRARKTGPDALNEDGGSLLTDVKETQKGGPSTYTRRRSRQVLGEDVNTVKNKYGLTSGDLKWPNELSSNGSVSLRSSRKTLASDLPVEVRANSGTFGAQNDVAVKPSSDLGNQMSQALHGDVNLHSQDFNSSLPTMDVMPLDVSPFLDTVDPAILYEGPFPSFPRPLPEECSEVCHRLSLLHGPLEEYAKHKVVKVSDVKVLQLEHHTREDSKDTPDVPFSTGLQSLGPTLRRTVLDSLVGTMLSQNTTDTNSRRAFASLKARFPTWESVYEADPKAVEQAIRCGGLAEIKTARILNILQTLDQERGKLCLEYVRELSTDEIKVELSRFKGVGPKTIACVLMFHLQQNEFPVDTHVFRITKLLGWVPTKADREKAYLHLNHRIPDHLKFDLHCLLVTHGKSCPRCAKGGRARRPADGPCPLVNLKQKLIESADCDVLLES